MKIKYLCAIGVLAISFTVIPSHAQTTPDESYFNEAFETVNQVDGEINIVTPYGKASSLLYKADTYGTINVYDEATNQLVMYGQVYENGTKVMVNAGKPRPSRPTKPVIKPTVRGGGWAAAVCYAGEAVSLARCEAQCRGHGVMEYTGGYCGFNSTCKCQTPPPPPPSPIPTSTLGWNFTPPWQTIVQWTGGERNPGISTEEP